jgi:hypothetical protein
MEFDPNSGELMFSHESFEFRREVKFNRYKLLIVLMLEK